MMHQNPKPSDREKELLDLLRSSGVDPRTVRTHQHFDERWSRSTPWYNRGWVWLLVAMLVLVVLAFLLADIGGNVRLSADATRQQTNVMQEPGQWMSYQLGHIGQFLSDISRGVARLVQSLQQQMTGH